MDEEPGSESINYTREALLWPFNWIVLTAAILLAVLARSAAPLLVAAGFELMYLSTVPHNQRFQRLVRSWKYEERRQRNTAKLTTLFHELPEPIRLRYVDMRNMAQSIQANYAQLSSTSQIFVKQTEDRLRGLLQGYLRLLHSAYKHREFLRTASPDVIRRDIADIERKLPSDLPKVQEINRKRIEIMNKRLEKYDRVQENCAVIDAQCAAIEDVLKLIRDQSLTLRDPQQVNDQLETLVRDVEQTEQTVREVEAVFELGTPELLGMSPLAEESGGSEAAARNRIRI